MNFCWTFSVQVMSPSLYGEENLQQRHIQANRSPCIVGTVSSGKDKVKESEVMRHRCMEYQNSIAGLSWICEQLGKIAVKNNTKVFNRSNLGSIQLLMCRCEAVQEGPTSKIQHL